MTATHMGGRRGPPGGPERPLRGLPGGRARPRPSPPDGTPPEDDRPIPPAARLLVAALAVARTPDVPVPALDEAPAPTRDEAERAA